MDAWALGADSPASWTMTPAEYAELWGICEETITGRLFGAKLIIGGLVSGQPSLAPEYVRAVKRIGGHPSAIDVHPYARDAESAAGLLFAYHALLAMPYVVLEWHRDGPEIPGFVRMMERRGIEYAAYFSWAPFDIPALLDEQGNRTERYHRYVQALREAPAPKEVSTMGKLEEVRAAGGRGWVIGNPWKEPHEAEPSPPVELQATDGRIVRLASFDYGVGVEMPSGTVYQPLEGTDASFAAGFANALQHKESREVMRAALEAAGFRLVSE
jgi:hypothetical protein